MLGPGDIAVNWTNMDPHHRGDHSLVVEADYELTIHIYLFNINTGHCYKGQVQVDLRALKEGTSLMLLSLEK